MSNKETSKKYKYSCKRCNFFTECNARLKIHKQTKKHRNKDEPRSDKKKPDKCELCSYNPSSYEMYRRHKLTDHSNKEEREKTYTYYCKTCDVGTFCTSAFKVHTNSKQHIRRTE